MTFMLSFADPAILLAPERWTGVPALK